MATANKDFKVRNGIVAGSTITAPAATTSIASLNIPHGTAPSAPNNGDLWTTTTGVLARVNGATVDLTSPAGFTTTATAAGTTTLTATSTRYQLFTGTSTQTVILPVTSTLKLGDTFYIDNNSTGLITVQSSGANTILTVPGGSSGKFACILTSGTTAASWDGGLDEFDSYTGTGANVLATSPTFATSVVGSATMAVFNTTSTTVSAFGAATTLSMGAATGTATIANATVTLSNATTLNVNGANPTVASSSTGTLTLFNTNIATVNAFGAATTLTLGSVSTATKTINISTASTSNGASNTVNIATGSIVAATTTTVNIGPTAGTTAVSSIVLSGKISRPATSQNVTAWTTSGQALDIAAATFTDTSTGAAGTVATRGLVTFNTPTLASTNAITVTDAATVYIANRPTAGTNTTITNGLALLVAAGKSRFAATATTEASIQLPHGTAPTSPANGDVWTTTAGMYVQVNGVTVGPLGSGGGAAGLDDFFLAGL